MNTSQLIYKLPVIRNIQTLAQSRGWLYIGSWVHRISGIFLVIYLFFHVVTLSSLTNPEKFVEKMQFFSQLIPGYLEWFLAIPVIYHSLNGGRLILYELFGLRNERVMVRAILVISVIYLFLLGSFMVAGNQKVTSFLFWSQVAIGSTCLMYLTIDRLMKTRASIFWKFQRISGAFLFLMVPAHMLFMHLDPQIGRDIQLITSRMDSVFIKCIDSALVISALYHGCYGLTAICLDYVSDRKVQIGCIAGVILVTVIIAVLGINTIVLI